MSLLKRRWQLYQPKLDLSRELSTQLNISPITAQVLINRGLQNLRSAENFLSPKLNSLYDPLDIPHIQKAAHRVLLARDRGEKVVVYGDYDVDGVTGTAILLSALELLGVSASYYIPHRYQEGYGLNIKAIEKLYEDKVNLIITVDCGIANLIEIELANSLGMQVVVTDHHNIPTPPPAAYAIVNPKLIPRDHPSKDLSGAGVAFKFVWQLFKEAGITDNSLLTNLLDLAGLGTVADIVPLLDENRILTVFGLKALNQRKRMGLRCLAEVAGLYGRITVKHVNFVVAPRLNAAGRLEHARLSLNLLLSKDQSQAWSLAQELNRINSRRQEIGSSIQKETDKKLENYDFSQKLLILSGEGWHPGVMGIVASRAVDRYYRPTVLIGVNEGSGRGSARSIEGFNIYELLETCRDLFTDFGGHEGAAGFEIPPENIEELVRRLREEVDGELSMEDLSPKVRIDAEISVSNITMSLAAELESLDPHGMGNPPPLFMTPGLRVTELKRVGNGNHLKARFTDGRVTLEAIGFNLGFLADRLSTPDLYDIAYNLEINEWGGFESAQLSLVDIRPSA